MHGGFEMIARIPYPITVPKFYAIASEVATTHFLCPSELPVSEVYDYSPSSDNAAKMEYIFMGFMRSTKLSDVWLELDMASVLCQLAQLESRMMSILFPASGSLSYTNDMEKVTGRTGILLNDEHFCVDLDARLDMRYGRRSQLDVDRGPYKSAKAALVAAARKESAYLEQFGRPLFRALIPPSLLANMDKLDQSEQTHAIGLYHRRLVHFHYVKNTEEFNKLHHDALSDPVSMFICRLSDEAGTPWEGETYALKATLIEAMEVRGRLMGHGVLCPVVLEPEDLHKTKELSTKLQVADENFEGCRGIVGPETETWVSNEHYAMAMALAELLKLRVLKEIPEVGVRAKTEANWFLNDMDEKDYM